MKEETKENIAKKRKRGRGKGRKAAEKKRGT